MDMSELRRLAAIFAADVIGYSRLVEADKGGTIVQLNLIEPTRRLLNYQDNRRLDENT